MKQFISLSDLSGKFFTLISFYVLVCTVQVSAQKSPGCRAKAEQVYFVASGQMVMDIYPGGNGYQLNIIGNGTDKFEVVMEAFMTSVYVIPDYTNSTQAKWQISFAQGMERVICSVKMKNKCTGEILTYPLTAGVRLFNR